jgi:hypothetical protein
MFLQEISLIILQILFIYLFFNNPIFNLKTTSKIIETKYFTNIDLIILNIVIFLNLLIIISIFSISSKIFFYIYVLLICLMLIKKNSKKIKLNYNLKDIIILLLTIFLSLDLAYTLIFGWDVQWFWYLKALNFYQDQNFLNLNKLPVADYPHLGPYIWAFFWKYPFGDYEYLGRIVYIFFYVLAIFSFSETLKINNQLRSIVSLMIILATYKYNLFSGDSDTLVFIFVLFASKFINYLYQSENKNNQYTLILLLLGITNILFWIKHEAIFFIIFIISSIIIFNKLINKKNKFILICSCLFFILFKFIVLKFLEAPIASNQWYDLNDTIYFNIEEFYFRTKKILFYIFVYLIQNPIYLLNLPLMIISIKFLRNNSLNKSIIFFTILFFGFTFFAYFFKHKELEFQLRNSMTEFLFSVCGFYLLVFTNFVNSFFSKIKK